MNSRVEALVEQARQLPPEERVVLADALHAMVNPPDPAWEEAWAKECQDRLAAYDRGEMEAVDHDEAMASLKLKYRLK
jgi:hypothetical protein